MTARCLPGGGASGAAAWPLARGVGGGQTVTAFPPCFSPAPPPSVPVTQPSLHLQAACPVASLEASPVGLSWTCCLAVSPTVLLVAVAPPSARPPRAELLPLATLSWLGSARGAGAREGGVEVGLGAESRVVQA